MEDMMMAFMDNLPVGYRFHPTDEEILCHYLKRKNLGLDEPVCVIPEVDLYRWEPEELRGKFTESSSVRSKDPELWFFCEQKPGRTQPRSTKRGYWKKTGQPRDMKSRYGTKQVIGSKNILTFFRGNNSSSTKTDWVMHEFHLPSNALDGLLHGNRKNYIVCMIRCNSDEMANSPPSDEFEQDEPITMDIPNIFEQEADDGLIPEDLVQARMQSLAQDCWTPDDRGNLNFQPILSQFLEHSNSSSESSRTQFLFGRDSIETNQPLRQTQACWTSDDRGNLNFQPIFSQFHEHSSSSPESSRTQFLFGRDSIETNQPLRRTQACWTSDDRGNLNFQPILSQFLQHSNSSPESSRTQFSFGRDSIEMESSFSDIGDIDILPDFLHQDNFYETPRHHQQNVVIMENKQTQKVESLAAYLPIHEKKGVVEDDSAQPAASSLRMDTHRVKCKKESRKVVLQASSEAVAVKQAPLKIKEEMMSATSSSASIRKPRAPLTPTPVERRPAAATTKKKEINPMAALSGHGKPARELKPITTTKEPISHSSTCTSRKCSCSNQSMVYFQNTLVGVILLIVIFCEIFNLTF